jgi:hypothetical protein
MSNPFMLVKDPVYLRTTKVIKYTINYISDCFDEKNVVGSDAVLLAVHKLQFLMQNDPDIRTTQKFSESLEHVKNTLIDLLNKVEIHKFVDERVVSIIDQINAIITKHVLPADLMILNTKAHTIISEKMLLVNTRRNYRQQIQQCKELFKQRADLRVYNHRITELESELSDSAIRIADLESELSLKTQIIKDFKLLLAPG